VHTENHVLVEFFHVTAPMGKLFAFHVQPNPSVWRTGFRQRSHDQIRSFSRAPAPQSLPYTYPHPLFPYTKLRVFPKLTASLSCFIS